MTPVLTAAVVAFAAEPGELQRSGQIVRGAARERGFARKAAQQQYQTG